MTDAPSRIATAAIRQSIGLRIVSPRALHARWIAAASSYVSRPPTRNILNARSRRRIFASCRSGRHAARSSITTGSVTARRGTSSSKRVIATWTGEPVPRYSSAQADVSARIVDDVRVIDLPSLLVGHVGPDPHELEHRLAGVVDRLVLADDRPQREVDGRALALES